MINSENDTNCPENSDENTINNKKDSPFLMNEGHTTETGNSIAENRPKIRKPIRVSIGTLIVSILLTALIAFQATFIVLNISYNRKVEEAYGSFSTMKKLIEIVELYQKEYLYDVNMDSLEEMLAQTYVYASGDKYASYYTAEEWLESVSSSLGNSVGIGVYVVEINGFIQVVHVMKDSPAEMAGIRVGDIITSVDGYLVSEVGYEAAVNYVRGEIGSVVPLTIIRDQNTLTIDVIRGNYTAETVLSEIISVAGRRYGYIRITEFMTVTVKQFKDAVNTLTEAGVEGFIFDVRDNPGGELKAICDILDFLVPEGPIAHIIGADGEEREVYTSGPSEINLPMVVLANSNTASAAELFTSTLRDYGKAEIVGTLTYGKGCGQEGTMLSDGSVVFITSFFYNPPFSENYDGIGIIPDITVELPEKWQNKSLFLLDREEDTQFAAALEILKIK